jgi:hypothetical protein
MVDGYVLRQKHRTNELTTMAWQTANFVRAKKLPSLSEFLLDVDKAEQKEQTTDEMFAVVQLLNAALGGTVVEA